MFALDLFNNDHERRLAEGAVDQLEQRRIDDLSMKMDDLVARAFTPTTTAEVKQALMKEFQKCKDERDSYYKVNTSKTTNEMGYGSLGEDDMIPVGRMQPGTPEYAAARNRSVKYAELTPDYTGGHKTAGPTTVGYKKATNKPLVPGEVEVAEAGLPDVADKAAKMDRLNQPGKVGTDVVTPQQRVNPNPNKGVIGHAADWLRGRGGPGKEGPTLESELDEQEGDSRVYAARLVFQQIIKAVQDNVDFATITWPDNSSQKLTRNQLWHLVQKARGMSRQARNQFALKVLPTVNDLMYYLGNLKKVDARPQVKMPVDPNQPSLDLPKPLEELAQKKNSEDPDLDSKTARDATVQRELQKMRARQPNARSDIEALVKDEMVQQEKTNQELEQLQSVNSQQDAQLKKITALNQQQEQEVSSLNQELDRLDNKLNQVLSTTARPQAEPEKSKSTIATPSTISTTAKTTAPATVDNKTDQEIAKLQSQINQLETMMTLKAPSDPAAEARLQQQISKLETQIKKLSKRPTAPALPTTAAPPTPVGSTPQLPNIEPTTLPAIEVPSVRAGSNDINVGNRRPAATTDNDFDILDLGDFDDIVDEPDTKKKKKNHQDTTVDRPAGTAPFAGGTKNNQWGPKNMPGGRFTVQDVDPYDIGVHEAVEPGEEISTNELLYRAAVEFMQHMGREGRPIDYETAVKLAAKHYHIPYRPGMVPELHAKRQELDAKLDAAIRARQAERGARKQRQLARTAPTTPEQEKKMQDYWSKNAPQATRVKAPTRSLEEDQQLHVGDPIIVTAPNEFEGKTGEIYDFAPSGKFVIVNLYNHGKHSMHLSDVEYNQYANDQDEKEFWNGDNEVNESNMSELDAMRQDLELMNDRQFKVAYGISKVAFRQKYRTLLTPADQQDVPVDEGYVQIGKYSPTYVCLAGKPVKKFDYYEDAERYHNNWKKKLYREGNKEKADKITLMPIMDEGWKSALGGAALAGAMALGGAGAAQAQSSGPNVVNPTTVIQQIQSGKIQNQNDLMSALGNASNKQTVWKVLQNTAGMQGSNDVNSIIGAIGHKNTAGSQQPVYQNNTGQQQTVKSVNQPRSFVQNPRDDFEEAYTPAPVKPPRSPRGFNKQGTGWGNKLAQQTRDELAKKKQGVAEEFKGNVKDTELKNVDPANHSQGEGDFVKNQLHSMKRVITHLDNAIGSEEDLPDWVQSEIAQAADKIIGVMNYSISSKEQDIEKHHGGSALMKEVKADPAGSWVVYSGGKVVKFKTHTGAKAYAEKAGGKVASSEFYADKIQKQGVAEAKKLAKVSQMYKVGWNDGVEDEYNDEYSDNDEYNNAFEAGLSHAMGDGLGRSNPKRYKLEQGVAEQAGLGMMMGVMAANASIQLANSISHMSLDDLAQLTQIGKSVGLGAIAGGTASGFGNFFYNMLQKTLRMAKDKAKVDTSDIIKLKQQIISIHKKLTTLKKPETVAKYQDMLKQAYEVLKELEAKHNDGVAEGDELTHAGQDVMVWTGPPTNNPPRDDKKYWVRGQLDSTEMHGGSMRANVMTAKGMYNPELSRVFNADMSEAYTPSPAKPFRNPPGFNKQGTGVGNRLAQQNRYELERNTPVKTSAEYINRQANTKPGDPIPPPFGTKSKIQVKKNKGVAEGHADQQRRVFKKNGEPVGEVGIDRESSPGNGQWYMKHYASGKDNVGYDSYEEALAELKHCMKQGVAESSASGSEAYDRGYEDGVRGKDQQCPYKPATSDWQQYKDGWHDGRDEYELNEGQTDYQKRRQRERDVDAGKPVPKQRQFKQTDYARKRAKDRKDMELGEMHEPQKFIVTINGKATSPLYADMADRLYIAAKRAQPNARIEKTLSPTTERQKGIDRVKAGYGDEDALELHEQGLMKPPTNRKEYLDQRDKLFRMLAVDANPVNKQIIKQALKDLDDRYDSIKNPVNEENSTSSEAVEIALIRRVLVSHTELIMEFGLDKVTQAIEEVAYNVGDVDEIGTSDVSGWIHQVKQILGVE